MACLVCTPLAAHSLMDTAKTVYITTKSPPTEKSKLFLDTILDDDKASDEFLLRKAPSLSYDPFFTMNCEWSLLSCSDVYVFSSKHCSSKSFICKGL